MVFVQRVLKLYFNNGFSVELGPREKITGTKSAYAVFKGKLRRAASPKTGSRKGAAVFIEKIVEVRKLALRRGVWFRALSRLERGVVDLTVKYYDNVKSTKLAKVLTAILEKLQHATENTFDRLVRTVGTLEAQKISGIAVSWGNLSALAWAQDVGFASYFVLSLAKT